MQPCILLVPYQPRVGLTGPTALRQGKGKARQPKARQGKARQLAPRAERRRNLRVAVLRIEILAPTSPDDMVIILSYQIDPCVPLLKSWNSERDVDLSPRTRPELSSLAMTHSVPNSGLCNSATEVRGGSCI